MSPAGFEPAIPVIERPQTHALDRTAIGIGKYFNPYVSTRFSAWIFTKLAQRYHVEKTYNEFRGTGHEIWEVRVEVK